MKVDKTIVEEFKKGIRAKTEAYSKAKGLANAELEVYMDAIYLGYLDACRTFRGQKKLGCRDENIKNLAEQLKTYIDAEKFKFEHEKYCSELTREYNMSFGQAQKIVNMAFKYLYSLTKDGDAKRDRFDKCHMPLDGIMLEWIHRNIKWEGEKLSKEKMGAWSSMQKGDEKSKEQSGKYTYAFYQEVLNKYCEAIGKTQLQLDFENWKEMSLTLATETFLKNFGKDKKKAKDWIDKVTL